MEMGHGNDIVACRGITLDSVALGVVARKGNLGLSQLGKVPLPCPSPGRRSIPKRLISFKKSKGMLPKN